MALSVCCQWLEPRTKRDGSIVFENSIKEKTLQLGAYKSGKYDDQRLHDTYHNNVDNLIALVPKLVHHGMKAWRLSSNVFPLFEFESKFIKADDELLSKLAHLGKLFLKNNIRVTTHPGQFAVVSSDSPTVVENTVRELTYHAWMFDAMGFPCTPHHAINIHGGKKDRVEEIIARSLDLPDNVRKRLTYENDEKCYNPKQLLKISERTGIPIVWDSHHHTFNDSDMTMEEAMLECMATWPDDVRPLQHISNTEPELKDGNFSQRRKHSWHIHYIPDCQREVIVEGMADVDVEAKGKNVAVLQMCKKFDLPISK